MTIRNAQLGDIEAIETTAQHARTREFSPKQGDVEEARIRRFYGPGDDKVVFWKSLTSSS